ncbi:MAG: hypothetical protein IKC06_00355 [Clostridia bacterium]|nr:hypothetical protein [Clostridia bacterium]
MKEFTLWKKMKEYEWKKLLNTKNFVIAGCLALVAAAVVVSTIISNPGDADTVGNESNKTLGNAILADGTLADGNKDENKDEMQTQPKRKTISLHQPFSTESRPEMNLWKCLTSLQTTPMLYPIQRKTL